MCQDRDDKEIGTQRAIVALSPARGRPRLRGHLGEPVRRLSSSVISRAVDVGPMVDPEDDDPRRFVIYLMDHPVRPAPGGWSLRAVGRYLDVADKTIRRMLGSSKSACDDRKFLLSSQHG
jgi:hypothetical protein